MALKRDEKGRLYYDKPGEYAEAPIAVKFTLAVDAALRQMGTKKAEYIRAAVADKLKRDGKL